MHGTIDLTGKIFGHLLVLERKGSHPKWRQATWLCQCTCGAKLVMLSHSLRSGNTKSCGCLKNEMVIAVKTKHGHKTRKEGPTPEYITWEAMRARCYNPNNISYKYYGKIGVKVCARWRKSFTSFLEDMGHRPSARHSIDRKDPFGHYTPKNCRWATATEQRLNQRRVRNSTGV